MSETNTNEQSSAYEFFQDLRASFKNRDEVYSFMLQTTELLSKEEVNTLHDEFNITKCKIQEDFNLIETENKYDW